VTRGRALVAAALVVSLAHAAAAEEMIAVGDERCVRKPTRQVEWALSEPTVLEAVRALAGVTCEWYFVPARLKGVPLDVKAPPPPETRSPEKLRARVLEALRKKGVTIEPQRALRLAGGPADAPPEPPPHGFSEAELDRGLSCEGTRCTLTRALLDRILDDTTALSMSARFVPSIKDGKANGFKVYAIRPGSLLARGGLQNGDTIRTVNGLDLTSPDHALEAYSKLRSAGRLTLELERRGETVTLDWVIR
jgi:DNA-binding transcriptional ArsR family regulator